MKRTSRIISVIATISMILSMLCIVPQAAEAQVVEIDGINTVFVSAFGRVAYDGKTQTSFKTLAEGIEALGNGGGKVIFTGQHRIESDTLGSGDKLILEGVGTKATGNVIEFTQTPVTFTSDIELSTVAFKVPEQHCIVLDGNDFVTSGEFDAFYTVVNHTTGERRYQYPLNIIGGTGKLVLSSGTFNSVSSSNIEILGGTFENLIVGSDLYDLSEDATAVIGEAEIKQLTVGANESKMSGNISLDIDGAIIETLSTGAFGAGSEFSGNLVANIRGQLTSVGSSGDGAVTGKIIYVCTNSENLTIDENAKFENLVSLSGGTLSPAYDENGSLVGLYCYDNYGCLAEKLVTKDGDILPENGMFKVSPGALDATIVSALDLRINDSASFVKGYEDGSFGPQNNMTRAEAIVLLTRIITDEKIVSSGNFLSSFDDVADGKWYAPYIEFFNRVGLLYKLSSDGKMNPNAPITRAEFVQLIHNIESIVGTEKTYANFSKLVYNVSSNIATAEKFDEFSDVRYDNTHNNAIYHAIANGYVNGYSDGTFKPDGNITRAEVVTVVNRMLGRRPTGKSDAELFPDTASHWAKDQVLAAVGSYGVAWTRSSDEKSAADGTALPAYVEKLMTDPATSLVSTIAVNVYKNASASLVSDDIKTEEKQALTAVLDSLKAGYREVGTKRDLTGTPDDPNHYFYSYMGKPYVRDITIKAVTPSDDKVEIVQMSDTHFNYINAEDRAEQNPSIMSTEEYRKWLAGGSSVGVISKILKWANYSDQTVVTGDILDYMSHGAKELTIKTLFRADTNIMAAFGNHDITRVCQGKVSDPTTLESRVEWLQEFWPHNTYYASKVVKDKVMCIVLDNGKGSFWQSQIEPLKRDIALAREKGYTVLLFYHIPLATRNPAETSVVPIRNNDNSGNHDFYSNAIGKEGTTGPTGELYDIITSSADVIKGAFCGHYHSAYYSEILAHYTDENGNRVDTVIPQYVQTASVYDSYGYVLRVTVE